MIFLKILDVVKVLLRGKVIPLSAFVRKQELTKLNKPKEKDGINTNTRRN